VKNVGDCVCLRVDKYSARLCQIEKYVGQVGAVATGHLFKPKKSVILESQFKKYCKTIQNKLIHFISNGFFSANATNNTERRAGSLVTACRWQTQIHNQNFHFIVKCNFFLHLKESTVNVVNGW
jgi:hypothetical protein